MRLTHPYDARTDEKIVRIEEKSSSLRQNRLQLVFRRLRHFLMK
jgi:hypothetical protein